MHPLTVWPYGWMNVRPRLMVDNGVEAIHCDDSECTEAT